MAGPAEGSHLPGEHLRVAVVVTDRAEAGRVVGQGDGGQRRALEQVAAGQLAGHVLGVGRAATVAEQDHLAAVRAD